MERTGLTEVQDCGACGQPLPPLRYHGNPRKWCSEACRVWAFHHPGERRPVDLRCEVCDGPIVGRQLSARYCSRDCHRMADVDRLITVRAAAAGCDAPAVINRLAIFERDNWRCRICGGRVSPHKRAPDPLCASIDHIVSLSQGGAHTPENLQLAHRRCNTRKQ